MTQGSQNESKNIKVKGKVDKEGLAVEGEIPLPEPEKSRWGYAWGLLTAGAAGAAGVLFIGTGAGIIIAVVGVAGVAAKAVVDGVSLPDDKHQEQSKTLRVAPTDPPETEPQPPSAA